MQIVAHDNAITNLVSTTASARHRRDRNRSCVFQSRCYEFNMPAVAETAKRPMVLIADDERAPADLLVGELECAGFDARFVPDRSDITQSVRSLQPDLVLLDVMPPQQDVLSICRELRDFTDIPIVIVMPRNDEIDRLIAFELGAVDCICKPFGLREVIAR